MSSTAWVLGAGFSKSLGGPLLGDLFAPELIDNLDATYEASKYPRLFESTSQAVLYLYHYGVAFTQGRKRQWKKFAEAGGERMWRDPEDFLDVLDSAARGGSASPAFRRVARALKMITRRQPSGENVQDCVFAAKRLFAAECSAFLVAADPDSERWEPYVQWAKQIGEGDTVLTFNYDLVPDLLARHTSKLRTVPLGESVPRADRAPVYKLHGSVNWKRTVTNGINGFSIEQDPDFCCKCLPGELTLATPGPSKREMAIELQMLWDQGLARLKRADVVVFLGYRFPPSDAAARRQLLEAIATNTNKRLAVHTVLGPDIRSPDSVRLSMMLQHTLLRGGREPIAELTPRDDQGRFYKLVQHPLWAEDFLSVVPGGTLAV